VCSAENKKEKRILFCDCGGLAAVKMEREREREVK